MPMSPKHIKPAVIMPSKKDCGELQSAAHALLLRKYTLREALLGQHYGAIPFGSLVTITISLNCFAREAFLRAQEEEADI